MTRRNFKKLGLSETELIFFKKHLSGRFLYLDFPRRGKINTILKHHIKLENNILTDEMMEWCDINLIGFWASYTLWTWADDRILYYFHFTEENDAIMFKLRFA
jgi:hypothetical protein